MTAVFLSMQMLFIPLKLFACSWDKQSLDIQNRLETSCKEVKREAQDKTEIWSRWKDESQERT